MANLFLLFAQNQVPNENRDTPPSLMDERRKDTARVANLPNQVRAKLQRKDAVKLPKHLFLCPYDHKMR